MTKSYAAGDKAFCAGADLKERIGMSEPQVLEQLALYRSELGWLGDFRAPVVAAINGVALNELVGPVLFKWALDRAGETSTGRDEPG